jgi:shikimate kinase
MYIELRGEYKNCETFPSAILFRLRPMSSCQLVILIGYRGTGKSTVAPALAAKLGWGWIDADDEIERLAGKSIAAMFADDGETAFRDLESQVVTALCGRSNFVVALGGGAVLREANRAAIRLAGPVIWLRAGVDALVHRLAADATTASRRPQLTGAGGRAEIEALLAARTPHYQECATVTIDTEGKSPDEIADEIVAKL